MPENPFFSAWTTPDAVPPFSAIRPEHFRPAYERALAEHDTEISAIAADPTPPSFDNTIAALEGSGRALTRVSNVFHVLAGAHSNDALLEIEREIAPQIARHWNKIHTNAALFRRIDTLTEEVDGLGLSAEQKRVLERYHITFRRAGAGLDAAAKKRLAEIIERLAALGTSFSQNVLADEQAFALALHDEAELAGLPDVGLAVDVRWADGNSAITLARSVEGGMEKLRVGLPVLVGLQQAWNDPRTAKLPNILKSRKAPIERVPAAEVAAAFGAAEAAFSRRVGFHLPPPRTGAKMIEYKTPEEAAETLVRLLREEAKVFP